MLKRIKMHESADIGSAGQHLGHSAFPFVLLPSRSSRPLTSNFAHKQIDGMAEKRRQQRAGAANRLMRRVKAPAAD